VLDPVALAQLKRLHAELGGELVHHPLDPEGGFGPARAAVGISGHLGGEDPGALERVGVHLVDGREHERAEQWNAGRE
jgi:hypothetical protein